MWRDILSTVGDTQCRRGYHDARGGIMSTMGVFNTVGDTILCNLSTVGDIMIHVGDIMSTVRGVQYRGGNSNNKRFIPPRY